MITFPWRFASKRPIAVTSPCAISSRPSPPDKARRSRALIQGIATGRPDLSIKEAIREDDQFYRIVDRRLIDPLLFDVARFQSHFDAARLDLVRSLAHLGYEVQVFVPAPGSDLLPDPEFAKKAKEAGARRIIPVDEPNQQMLHWPRDMFTQMGDHVQINPKVGQSWLKESWLTSWVEAFTAKPLASKFSRKRRPAGSTQPPSFRRSDFRLTKSSPAVRRGLARLIRRINKEVLSCDENSLLSEGGYFLLGSDFGLFSAYYDTLQNVTLWNFRMEVF